MELGRRPKINRICHEAWEEVGYDWKVSGG